MKKYRMEISDYKQLHRDIIDWIRNWFEKNGKDCNAIIGISGGKDSTVCCALLCEAIGKDRVIGLMMPNGSQHDIDVSKAVCEHFGIKNYTVNIQHAVNTFKRELELCGVDMTLQTAYNIPPRVRMTTLYAFSQSLNGRVVNTSNLSEDYVGWMTIYGDAAGDFSPLSFLTVKEVKNLGYELGLPTEWVDKTPEDGLTGSSDEKALGVTYAQIDEYITTGEIDDKEAEKQIKYLIERSRFKLRPMAAFKPCLADLRDIDTAKLIRSIPEKIPERFKDKRQPWGFRFRLRQ